MLSCWLAFKLMKWNPFSTGLTKSLFGRILGTLDSITTLGAFRNPNSSLD